MDLNELILQLKQKENFEYNVSKEAVKFKEDEIGVGNIFNSIEEAVRLLLMDSISINKMPLSSRILLSIKSYGGDLIISEKDKENWNLKIYFK